jgi:hypothetical protein
MPSACSGLKILRATPSSRVLRDVGEAAALDGRFVRGLRAAPGSPRSPPSRADVPEPMFSCADNGQRAQVRHAVLLHGPGRRRHAAMRGLGRPFSRGPDVSNNREESSASSRAGGVHLGEADFPGRPGSTSVRIANESAEGLSSTCSSPAATRNGISFVSETFHEYLRGPRGSSFGK